jgi:hypothetical protein
VPFGPCVELCSICMSCAQVELCSVRWELCSIMMGPVWAELCSKCMALWALAGLCPKEGPVWGKGMALNEKGWFGLFGVGLVYNYTPRSSIDCVSTIARSLLRFAARIFAMLILLARRCAPITPFYVRSAHYLTALRYAHCSHIRCAHIAMIIATL